METVTALPRGEPLTRADLEQAADDGHRYELVDGTLVVTPAPSPRHQVVVLNLAIALAEASPPELRVLTAPLDVALADDTVLQPDVLVARRSDFSERDLPVTPLLAVEVLSPSTRLIDLSLKRARYQAAGCPNYWVIDPEDPAITAWELRGGEYVEAAHAEGDDQFAVTEPYPVALVPRQLVD